LIGFTKVADTAVAINRIVMKEFVRIGLKALSFAPLSMILSGNDKVHSIFISPIKRALEYKLIPVLYGDVIFDTGKSGFCIYSGEMLISALLAEMADEYRKVKVIYCTDRRYERENNSKD
jgi:isopentenyl phosphate kinase